MPSIFENYATVSFVLKHTSSFAVITLLVIIWLVCLFSLGQPVELLSHYGGFSLLGIIGAVFANATGAGGGVVFVPVFKHLAFSPQNIVATSFAIQCCGMTAGALSWWQHYKAANNTPTIPGAWSALPQAIALTVPASWCGITMAQYASHIPLLAVASGNVDQLHLGFGVFSVLLAVVIFASIPLMNRVVWRHHFAMADIPALILVAFVGGAITAWLSVGVGELVAVYLIVRGFNVTMAIAVAVILTAFSVWIGVIYHVLITDAVVWPVVLFAGAGAIIGGRLAKYVVLAFSVKKLKLFFGLWVLLLGVSSLPIVSG